MKRVLIGLIAVFVTIGGGLAASAQDSADPSGSSVEGMRISPLIDAAGNEVGLVAFGNDGEGVGGTIMVRGLVPGEHGIHLHAAGSCDPAGEKPFDSAGPHFNPDEQMHGSHAGDIGNIIADENGDAVFLLGSGTWTLDDGMHGLADADGTALVIHETVDDLVTDPSGNSGARIACAVLFASQ
jgi:Cu-Zn family superoxide dismutase